MPEEMVAVIINGDFYEKNVLKPHDEFKEAHLTSDETFDKPHSLSSRGKLNEVKKLISAYEKAFTSVSTVFGKKDDFEGIMNNIKAYYNYKDKEIDEKATYNSTLGRIIGENIAKYSKQIKTIRQKATDSFTEAKEECKNLKYFSKRRALRNAEKAFEKASKKFDFQANIRKRLKQSAMNQSVATKDSITHFIYNKKKETGMMASLIKANDLLADLIKGERKKGKISGYRKLNVKDIRRACKNLEDHSNGKEAFYGNLEKFNKVYEQISEHLLAQKSGSAKGNILEIIKSVNKKIDAFIKNDLENHFLSENGFKVFSKNLKANLNKYSSKLENKKQEWLAEFPSGARRLGGLHIEVYFSIKSKGLYDQASELLYKFYDYEKAVKLLTEGSTVLLASCAGISTAGSGFIYAVPFVFVGAAMTTVGAVQLVRAKVELNRSENTLRETSREISAQLAEGAKDALEKRMSQQLSKEAQGSEAPGAQGSEAPGSGTKGARVKTPAQKQKQEQESRIGELTKIRVDRLRELENQINPEGALYKKIQKALSKKMQKALPEKIQIHVTNEKLVTFNTAINNLIGVIDIINSIDEERKKGLDLSNLFETAYSLLEVLCNEFDSRIEYYINNNPYSPLSKESEDRYRGTVKKGKDMLEKSKESLTKTDGKKN